MANSSLVCTCVSIDVNVYLYELTAVSDFGFGFVANGKGDKFASYSDRGSAPASRDVERTSSYSVCLSVCGCFWLQYLPAFVVGSKCMWFMG